MRFTRMGRKAIQKGYEIGKNLSFIHCWQKKRYFSIHFMMAVKAGIGLRGVGRCQYI
jgi:hypothetical protein